MWLECLRQGLREPVQCLRPARLVQLVSSLGRERSMIENELRSVTMVGQRKRHLCLLVVGIGFFPHECKDEAPRRIDFRVLPAQVERLPVRWLHRDAVPPSLANIEFDAGSGEARWPPPPAQLIGLRACRKHARPRRVQNPFQMKRQPRRIDRHAVIIRRSAHTSAVRETATVGQCSGMSPDELTETTTLRTVPSRASVRECPLSDAPGSAHVFDDCDEFVQAVAVVPGELDQFFGLLDDDTTFGCPGDRNATPASELE